MTKLFDFFGKTGDQWAGDMKGMVASGMETCTSNYAHTMHIITFILLSQDSGTKGKDISTIFPF